jgi:hypothetical protein
MLTLNPEASRDDQARRLHNCRLKRDHQAMSPPPEQLIRDYLNRMSVAAKGRLSAEDRQALLARTRDFIERSASASGPATAMEVATLLSRLGDPATLVAREAGMLSAGRDDATEAPAAGGRRRGLLRRRSGPASWHWPLLPGNPAVQGQLFNGRQDQPEGRSAQAAGPGSASRGSAGPGSASTVSASSGSAGTGTAGANGTDRGPLPAPAGRRAEPPIWVPRQPSSPEAGVPGVRATGEPGPANPGRPAWPSTVAMRPDGLPKPEPGLFELPASNSVSRRIVRTSAPLIASAVKLARGHPTEALAVVLLGLGGAIFPPVWLLGVIAALASKAWDYRDKWIGLAGPVLLLVVGTVAGISLGASRSSAGGYFHETWVYADVLSRVGAVLGAAYLVWRLRHPRREPPIPPWTKPHKVG